MTVRAERIEIVRPLGVDWPAFGVIVHTQRTVIGQLKQAAADAVVSCDLVGCDAVKAAVSPTGRGKSPGTLAYQAAMRELERIRGAKWSEAQIAALNMPAKNIAFLARHATADIAAWKAAQYRKRGKGQGKKGRASYGRPQPISVPKDEWALERDERGFVLCLHLVSGTRFRVALHPRGGRSTLPGIEAGTHERHDCKLVYCERKRKWYAIISYTAPTTAPVMLDPARVLVVHRGLRNALTLLSSTGSWRALSGEQFAARRQQLSARQRDARRLQPVFRGAGSRGHGKRRALANLEALEDKFARVTKTFCQQCAAAAVTEAKRTGCGLVLIEDYGGIAPDDDGAKRKLDHGPLFQLKEAIANAVEREGLSLETVDARYVSTSCPRCDHVSPRSHNRRTNVFHCPACQLNRAADQIAAINMLALWSPDAAKLWIKKLESDKRGIKNAVSE